MRDAPTLDALLAANERFYRTFETLDYDALAALWEQSDRVFCVHPGWTPLWGHKAVLESWARIIENTGEIFFNLSGEQGHLAGGNTAGNPAGSQGSSELVGTVTCFESIQNVADQQRMTSGVVSTNLFAYNAEAGMWKIFHHHASHTLVPTAEDDGVLLV